jgi:septal ring factor EnvC (AmiA/AmiB activator)
MKLELYEIIIAVALSATGFWRIIEMLFERNKYKAETLNLYAQVNSHVITNYIAWSQKLEERVKELEGRNNEMDTTIQRQKQKIQELEKQISQLEERNITLMEEIGELNRKS